MKVWSRIAIVSLTSVLGQVQAGEFILGTGTSTSKGGLMGMENDIESDSVLLGVKDPHTNLFDQAWFYDYSILYMTPNDQLSKSSQTESQQGGTVNYPQSRFSIRSFDAQVTLGYDFYRQGKFDYLGAGLSLGIALPYIKNSGDQTEDNDGNNGVPVPIAEGESEETQLLAGTTEMMGFRLGPKIVASRSWNDTWSYYGEASYAPQIVHIRNSSVDSDLNVKGTFLSLMAGVKYQLWKGEEYDLAWLTLGPEAYLDIGVMYSHLHLKKFSLDLSGRNYDLKDSSFDMRNSALYAGIIVTF